MRTRIRICANFGQMFCNPSLPQTSFHHDAFCALRLYSYLCSLVDKSRPFQPFFQRWVRPFTNHGPDSGLQGTTYTSVLLYHMAKRALFLV